MKNSLKIRINRFIDHTILKSNARFEDIKRYCREVEEYNFYALCIAPCWIEGAKQSLDKGKVCSVAGFPLGSQTLKVKLFEIEELYRLGADEIDVVANIGLIVERDYKRLADEIKNMVKASGDKVLKVIIETPLLDKEMIMEMTKVIIEAGAQFVKTGTGFYGPVKVGDVKTIARLAKGKIGIKAAGGIRTYEQAIALIHAGATRIGTSTGVKIIHAS